MLLGHQKRILVSLGNDRPGFDGMWRKAGNKVTDISRIVQVGDVRIDGEEDIYFKHDFSGLQSKVGLHTFSLRLNICSSEYFCNKPQTTNYKDS